MFSSIKCVLRIDRLIFSLAAVSRSVHWRTVKLERRCTVPMVANVVVLTSRLLLN